MLCEFFLHRYLVWFGATIAQQKSDKLCCGAMKLPGWLRHKLKGNLAHQFMTLYFLCLSFHFEISNILKTIIIGNTD